MLEKLVRASVERRGVVLVLTLLLALLSYGAVKRLSVDAVPDVTNIQVSVLTSAPGLSPLSLWSRWCSKIMSTSGSRGSWCQSE